VGAAEHDDFSTLAAVLLGDAALSDDVCKVRRHVA
jgi:hypothetical protein